MEKANPRISSCLMLAMLALSILMWTFGSPFAIPRQIYHDQKIIKAEMAARLTAKLSSMGYKIDNAERFKELISFMSEASEKYGIERDILLSMAVIESGLDPLSLSEKGAQGIFQILPRTANAIRPEFMKSLAMNDPLLRVNLAATLNDPRLSTLLGAFYLSKLMIQFNQQLHLALAAYNVGPGALRKAIAQGELKGTEYIFRVFQIRNAIRGV